METQVKVSLQLADVRCVVAGVSGGADSVAMLLALLANGVETHAVHCNFSLRGEESDRDERFVRELCRKLGVGLNVVHFDTRKYMECHKVSAEVACRDLRYGEFRRRMKEFDADRITVAHNANDQAETVLLNLMRGSGVAGLRGMKEDTGEILRPLLSSTREDIINYLETKNQDYVTDSTNLESDYRRNFIRNEVLPLLESRWPGAQKSILRTADIMAREEKILDKVADTYLTDPVRLRFEDLDESPDPSWLIGRFARPFGASDSQILEMTMRHVSTDFHSGSHWNVPGGRISCERDMFEYIADEEPFDYEIEYTTFRLSESLAETIRKSGNEYFWTTLPIGKLDFFLPAQGDRIEPLGMKGSMLVSKIMKDAKLTRRQKENTLVAVEKDTDRILWVEGLKRSRHHLVTTGSETAYRYRIKRHDD